jgi:predicted house-cleaning NTP pyrophosphatase (Maf/HAM1 superfamily)
LFAVVCFAIDLSASYWVAHVSSQVATGTDPALDQSPLIRSFWEETVVEFAELEDEAICAYAASGEPMGKAGGYGIQGIGGSFVKGIEGCFFNVMGFPVHRYITMSSTIWLRATACYAVILT